jgi:pimeloyl-ACP methyl ester carboxylesterase
VLVVSLSACGGSDSDSLNDVSEPTIDERFTVGVDEKKVALLCYGEGSPLVFLEPGDDGDGTDGSDLVLRPLAERNMACTYARVGAGSSDAPSESRRTLDDVVAVLHDLVEAADLPVPLVHVGVSGGGYIALYHASRYPDDVAGVVLLDVAQDDPKEGAKIFPGAKAWNNPEHLDVVDAARRMMRMSALALDDIPLRVITASDGPSEAKENQSAWLKLSSDAQQTTLAGGHDLAEENADGVVAEIRKLLDAIED